MVEWIEIIYPCGLILPDLVSTLVVEWIEISVLRLSGRRTGVSTLVVEWIEIKLYIIVSFTYQSPPSWWSGLK